MACDTRCRAPSRAFEVQRWFSQGWLTASVVGSPGEAELKLCDVRHSISAVRYEPIFCLFVDDEGVRRMRPERNPGRLSRLWREMTERHPDQRAAPDLLH